MTGVQTCALPIYKVTSVPVEIDLIQAGMAAIKGVAPGARVVVEGGQNVRKDSTIAEAGPAKAGKSGEKAAPAGDKFETPPDKAPAISK